MPLTFRRENTASNVIPSISKFSLPNPVVSTFEGINMEEPSKLGTWYNNSRLGKTSLLAFLVGKGYETTAPGSSVIVEEVDGTKKNRYDFPNLVVRSGNNFTLNTAVLSTLDVGGYLGLQADPDDISWVLPILTEIVVYTESGKQRHGTVRSISPDGKTLTATCGDAAGWMPETTGLTVVTLATRNGATDCGDCFAVKTNSRFIENYFNTSSKCYSYNPSQLLSNNTFLSAKNGKFYHDMNMDRAITDLYLDVDASLLRSQAPMAGSADFLLDSRPKMRGMLEQLLAKANGATLYNDYITTIGDFIQLNDKLDLVNAPDEYMIMCNTVQYNFLQQLLTFNTTANVQLNPYQDKNRDLDWLNFLSIHIGGRKFSFSKWDALSQGTHSSAAAIASNPTFVMMPLGWRNVRTQSDNMKSDVPYVSLIWNGDSHTNMKLERRSNEGATNCLEYKVSWYSSYSLMVVGREHFVVGLPTGFNGYGISY